MTRKNNRQTILVVNDVEATGKSTAELLERDDYRIETARSERTAANAARLVHPDLMLLSLEGETEAIVECALRIRRTAALDEDTPIVIFCVGELEEGNEIAVEPNIYLAHPDNFNQLRLFISRLLLLPRFSENAAARV